MIARTVALSLLLATPLPAAIPEYTAENGVVRLKHVVPTNPILYDNDW